MIALRPDSPFDPTLIEPRFEVWPDEPMTLDDRVEPPEWVVACRPRPSRFDATVRTVVFT